MKLHATLLVLTRRLMLLTLGMALLPLVAEAQPEPSSTQVWGGYSYLPELDSFVQSFSDSGHGFAAGMSFDFQRHIGFVADFDTHAWTVREHGSETFIRGDQDIRLSYLSIGPRVVVPTSRVTAFGFGTFDFQWSHFSEQTIMDADNPDNQSCCGGSASAFGFGVGGGVDISLSRRIAVRAIQGNYSLGGFGEGPGRKLRVKSGIVFKF